MSQAEEDKHPLPDRAGANAVCINVDITNQVDFKNQKDGEQEEEQMRGVAVGI